MRLVLSGMSYSVAPVKIGAPKDLYTVMVPVAMFEASPEALA